MLWGGVVKGSALPVAACVVSLVCMDIYAEMLVSLVCAVCMHLCVSLGYALSLLLAECGNRKAIAVSISLQWRALRGSQGALDWAPAVRKEESPGLIVVAGSGSLCNIP